MFEILAGSCDGGDCPTFFIDKQTGVVRVRGYDLDDSSTERDIEIPADAWARLISNLPR